MSIGDPNDISHAPTGDLHPMFWPAPLPPPRVLKLTGYTGQPVWIFVANICALRYPNSDACTTIYLAGGDNYLVKETPEQILEMLK